jgi:hypothetical protein
MGKISSRVLVIFAGVCLVSCAEDRYRWNLAHAYVTPWTHLSQDDYDAIVRIMSHRDQLPIIGISAHRPDKKRGSTISVYTGNVNQIDYSFWHGYDLKKENGQWRIVFDGDCSHTIAGFDLSGEIHELEQKRRD